jgi:hypothetical protein
MTKYLAIIGFLIIFPAISFSQLNRLESKIKVDRHGYQIEVSESNYGLQFGTGLSFIYYDSNTKKFTGNKSSTTYKLSFFYKNYFIGLSFKPINGSLTEPTDTLHFEMDSEFRHVSASYYNTEILIGYTISLPLNFSIEPTIGYLGTNFMVEDEDGHKIESISDKIPGLTAGLAINKYIKLRSLDSYLVIFLNNSINFSNFESYHKNLGNSFYSIEFGIAMKGWFLKKTRI